MDELKSISFKNFEGWIPETDVDGIDVDSKFVSDTHAIRFGNGFIENNVGIELLNLPANVTNSISLGYTLKSSFNFTHSTQGEKTIYILWKGTAVASSRLLVYLDNTVMSIGNYEYSDEPNNINYNVINDEVKINLNCTATLSSKSIIMNLSLQYLEEVVYNLTNNIKRVAGWYLCPRWLGWQYNYISSMSQSVGNSLSIVEDFEDTSYNLGININNWTRSTTARMGSGYGLLAPTTTALTTPAQFSMSLNNPYILSMYIRTGVDYVIWSLWDDTDNVLVPYHSIENVSEGFKLVRWIINKTGTGLPFTFKLGSINYTSSQLTYPSCHVDNISYTQTTATVDDGIGFLSIILAKYYNGERGLITGSGSYDINGIYIEPTLIDWRIESYELYQKDDDLNTWLLKGVKYVDNTWSYDNGFVKATIPTNLGYEDNSSLDFRYNLPYNSRVDNQSYIYMEVSHKGRVYFIKDDFKVYQSHIAGNGVIQPDSFPYDEEQGFGYFIVSRLRVNLALAVSPTNDLVIFTDSGLYVYFIQPNGSTVFRQLKMVSGSVGISSRKSLCVNNEGNPATQGLMWVDKNGVYYYSGGVEEPNNLLLPAHVEYWRRISNSHKSSIVGFYNSARYEYSFEVNQKLINFEIPYKRFRVSDFYGIHESVGYKNSELYFRNNNDVYKFVSNIYSDGYFATHYNACGSESDDKIMQEIGIMFGSETNKNSTLSLQVYIDDNILIATYSILASDIYWKRLLPIRRFRKVKVKLSVTNSLKVNIREINLSYYEDKNEVLGVSS